MDVLADRGKRLETLRGLFPFCVRSGWIQANPAALIKPPKHKDSPMLPFSEEQTTAIRAAADKFWDRGIFGKGNRWNGRSLETSAVKIWERTMSRVFEMAKVENGHIHRFRDTFAVELLLAGVPSTRCRSCSDTALFGSQRSITARGSKRARTSSKQPSRMPGRTDGLARQVHGVGFGFR
jgi:hypothetical protein